jgi:YD repeat-containing protein
MSRGYRSVVLPGLLLIGSLGAAGCGRDGPKVAGEVPASAEAKNILSVLRTRSASPMVAGVARGFRVVPGGLSPRFEAEDGDAAALVVLPARATAAAHLEDAKSGVGVDISLSGARDVAAQAADGYVAYPHALDSGATVLHRALPTGTEDFVSFETRPSKPEIAYSIHLGPGVSGLRLAAGTLEMLDAAGTPRLHVAPPYIVGADDSRTDATLAVETCEVDESEAAPWGRPVTAPGAKTCVVRVSWDDAAVAYPAVLDPRWTTAGSMTVARQDHTATLLSTGKVLVAGGRSTSTGTTGLASAELYDPTTGTWAATGSMTGGRWSHTATQLNTNSNTTTSGKVLISGGLNGTTSQNTAQLYSPTAGTWVAAANLNAARHLQTATLLPSGNVLLAGGLSGTTVLNTAAIYNPASGTGTWTAVATNMASARRSHTATLLASSNASFNNKVLIAGGNSGGTTSLTSVQLFDATALTWSTTTALATAREAQTATTLANGNVLIAGGKSGTTTLGTTFVFTIPASGTAATWVSAGTMTALRSGHTATLLPSAIVKNGQVLVAGGSNGTSTLGTAELWNGTSTWTATTALATPVQGQTATLLSNNMILLAGGANGTTTVGTASLYDGSFSLACTSNSQCATGFCTNGVCCDTACNGGCGACNLSGKVGTCSAMSSGTVCRAMAGLCDVAETCNGTATTCPTDHLAAATTVCRPAAGACDIAENCSGTSSACPADAKKSSGTTCTDDGNACTKDQCDGTNVTCQHPAASEGTTCNDGNSATAIDACRSGSCVGTADPTVVLGFEALGQWSFSVGGAVVGLNANHTQGSHSLEVAVQNYQPLVSAKMASLGSVAPLVLLDILLPTQQGNPFWFGSVQMYVNAPSIGINNAFLGQAELTSLPLATWQTLAFQLTSAQVVALSGSYADLTFTIAMNVPVNEAGHYLLDNLRFGSDVIPSLLGIAQDSAGVTTAIFTYQTATSSNIPYGPANFLADQNGFIHAPADLPPQQFVPTTHPPFLTALTGAQLTWTVGSHSATATASSPQLPIETLPDGTRQADLPDGTKVPLDANPLLGGAIVPSNTSYTTVDKADDGFGGIFSGLPTLGPTSAGTSPGNFKVTNDGAAGYELPIETPAGRNGVEPHLSLIYNSRVGNGFLGPGWALQGLHRITRCKRTYGVGVEKGTDPSTVTYTSSDELCMDGERMVSIAPSEYRTKRDQQNRILLTSSDGNGPLTFTVYRKDGLIEYYGLDSSTRGIRQRITSISGSDPLSVDVLFATVTREWLLSKVVDRYGNTMTMTYQFAPVSIHGTVISGPGVPSTISYASNPLTGRAATKTISFSYSPSPATAVAKLESGVPINGGGLILSEIDVKAPNPVAPSLVTSYKMTYGTSSMTNRPLLARVQRCGSDGVCMAPTTFGWSPGSYIFRKVDSQIADFHPSTQNFNDVALGLEGATRVLTAGDFDGDGRDDLLYRHSIPPNTLQNVVTDVVNSGLQLAFGTANGFQSIINAGITNSAEEFGSPDPFNDNQFFGQGGNVFTTPVAVDLNGDGHSDVVTTLIANDDSLANRHRFDFYRSNGRSPMTLLPAGITFGQLSDPALNPPEASALQISGTMVLADLNGDGLMDFARQINQGDPFGLFGARLNTPSGLPSTYTTTVVPTSVILWGREIFATDATGDGRTAVVMFNPDGNALAVRGSGAGLQAFPTNIPSATATAKMLLDVNGDGLRDVIIGTQLWANTGNGFLPIGPVDPAIPTGLVVDLNGDGMDDVLVPGCSATAGGPPAKAYISVGNGAFTVQTLNIPSGLMIGTACPHVLMDVDGDGQKDLVQPEFGSDDLQIYYRNNQAADRIEIITNGIRASVQFGYSRFEASGNDGCAYPAACGSRNVEIVSGYTVDEGQVVTGQQKTTHYSMSYGLPSADAQGAGWLGFGTVSRTNDRTNVVDEKTFDLTTRIGDWFPFSGLPKLEQTTVPLSVTGRTIVRQRSTIYQLNQSDPTNVFGPYSVNPGTITESEIEGLSGQTPGSIPPQRLTVRNIIYDNFGNVTNYEVNHQLADASDVTHYDVTNDTDKWLIGKVNSVTRTSTSAANESEERLTTFQSDANTGAVIGETIQPGDPQEQLSIAYGRNSEGLVNTVTATPISGPPRTTRTDYDTVEGTWPAAYTNALGQVTRVAYHCGLGVLAATVDPNGVATQSQYDHFGRIRSTSDSAGRAVSLNYDRPDATSSGLIVSWNDSTGRTGVRTTDDLGREISQSEMAFDGTHQQTITRSYDAVSGQQGVVSRPFGANGALATPGAVWSFLYDESGRMTLQQRPNESATIITYTGLTAMTSVSGVEKGYRVEDELGRVTESVNIGPNGVIPTAFDYGPFGVMRHVQPAGGGTVTLSYDHLGRRTEIDDPDAGKRVKQYDTFGDVVLEQLAGQADVVYQPDLLGRTTSIEQGTSVTTFNFDTAANGIGKMESKQSPSGVSTAYTYQANGLPQSTTWTVENTPFRFDWAYSPSARLAGITFPDIGTGPRFAVSFGYAFDGAIAATFATNTSAVLWQKASVADDGQVFKENFADGLASIHDTDPASGRLTHISTGSGTVIPEADGGDTFQNRLQSLGYTYYADGKLQSRTDFVLGAAEGFTFDNVDRVTGWSVSLRTYFSRS